MKKGKLKSQQCLEPEGMNHRRFIVLNRDLLKLGLELITEQILTKEAKRFDRKPPDVARIKQTKDQLSYQKWFQDYCIRVHTSFNPNLGLNGGFTSIGGCGWVVINKGITERVYIRKFYRTNMNSFIKNIVNEVAFLINRLEDRPFIEGTNLLFNIKQTDVETVWVSPINKKVTIPFYLGKIPDRLRQHFDALKNRTEYYQNVVRPKKGITVRARDLRKKWKQNV